MKTSSPTSLVRRNILIIINDDYTSLAYLVLIKERWVRRVNASVGWTSVRQGSLMEM